MDILGRYYTANIISTLLINSLTTKSPKKIVDLGIGDASLTIAAYKRWKKAKFYATEIENGRVKEIQKKLSYVEIKKHNTLQVDLSSKLNIKLGSIDVAVCNPPYVKIKKTKKYRQLFEAVGMTACLELKQISSEVVFFAHNMSLLRDKGEMGIIVSDSLVTCKDYKIFRETILREYDLKRIIQLPDKIFSKTEARTHILVLNKAKSKSPICNLAQSDEKGVLSTNIQVSKAQLIERMDFGFWNYSLNQTNATKTLKNIGVEIKRGRCSYESLREGRLPYLHSNGFSEKPKSISVTKKLSKKHKEYASKAGDILMCRVGKRCVGKLVKINRGSLLNSDCVYRIRVPKKYRNQVWKSLTSRKGKLWLEASAHGVCAQVISKSDLENFPVNFKSTQRQ